MMKSLWTAATGMIAQQTNVDVISNNLSNANTTGYKKQRAMFQDLMYSTIKSGGMEIGGGMSTPSSIQIGSGTRLSGIQKVFTQGDASATSGKQLDVEIEGEGFFQIQRPNGQTAYTRSGNFELDSQGRICTSDGYLLIPTITVPSDATEIAIGTDGTVSAKIPNQTQSQVLGNLQIARFANPAGLNAAGHSLYEETTASSAPVVSTPGQDGSGTILQGYLELSNVEVVEEMINLISGQRAYEMNAKAITTSDEMLSTANRLKA